MTSIISTIFGALLTFLLIYKYAALFVVSFVAALAIPIPASTLLVAAGSFASQGYMNLYGVLAVALLGNILGDAIGYWVARHYGVKALGRIGLGRMLHSRIFKSLETHMRHFPQSVIFMTRFMTEAGPAVNVLSGLSGVTPRVYFFFEVLGEACYVALYGIAGYWLGTQWEANLAFLAKGASVIITLSIMFGSLQILLFKRKAALIREEQKLIQ